MNATCRHAVYCAVCDCGYPDPLSRLTRSGGKS
jgi:hypothetical protein